MALIDKLTAIADAIRGKTGKADEMTLDQMVTEIEGIQTGGGSGIVPESGTFVLDAESIQVTIPVTKKCTHVHVWHEFTGNVPSGFGAYRNIALFAAEGIGLYAMMMNYNATAIGGGGATSSSYTSNGSHAYFNESNIQLQCRTTGSGNQKFTSGVEYKWEAW